MPIIFITAETALETVSSSDLRVDLVGLTPVIIGTCGGQSFEAIEYHTSP